MTPISTIDGKFYNDAARASRADVASGVRTTSGTSAEFAAEDLTAVLATLVVTAASGTSPTLALKLETRVGDDFFDVGTFPTQTGPNGNGFGRALGPVGDACRWSWTIGGTTPSFTFSIDVSARRAK